MAAAVTADRVLAELQQLWVKLADQEQSASSQGVLRACAMTLVVLAEESDDATDIAATLGEVMHDHPHRAVIVRVRSTAGRLLEHRVTAQCWLPFGTRQQICCEQVEFDVSEESLEGLGPILMAITAPDLPVVAWCRSARMLEQPAFASLFRRAARVVVDSGRFPDAAAGLDAMVRQSAAGRRIADLAWGRITRWREIVAQIFEEPSLLALASKIRRMRILHSEPEPPVTAHYLASWILSCADCGKPEVGFEKAEPIGGSIEGLVLELESHVVSIRRAVEDAVLIEVDTLKNCTVIPRLADAELLRTELSISGQDAVFERSLPKAAELARSR